MRQMMKDRSKSVTMVTNLTEAHSYPHRGILCIYNELGYFVSFVSVIFYKFRKERIKRLWGINPPLNSRGKGEGY